VDDGPTERESSEKFYKTLEKDGVLITIRLPKRGKN